MKPVSIYNTVIFLTMEGSICIAVKKIQFLSKILNTMFKTSYDTINKKNVRIERMIKICKKKAFSTDYFCITLT